MQLQRAVLPARVNATAKLFAIAVLFAGLAAGATIAMIQAHVPPRARAATHGPDWRWHPHEKLTYVELARDFTLSTHVRVTNESAFDPILSNGEIMLGLRRGAFEFDIFERGGATIRFENSTELAPGSYAHVAITRSGTRVSLWVNGNETRIEHDQPTLSPERLAVANKWRVRLGEVSIWSRALGAQQLAVLR